jgi:hypothetical protein
LAADISRPNATNADIKENAMYSPKINEQHIPALYHLGKHVKKPMTRLVDKAIRQYLERQTIKTITH